MKEGFHFNASDNNWTSRTLKPDNFVKEVLLNLYTTLYRDNIIK
jgi:hypothetical protein